MKKITLILLKYFFKIFNFIFFKYKSNLNNMHTFDLNKIKLINQLDKRVRIINNKIVCNFSDVKYENLLILDNIELDTGLYNLKFITNIFRGILNLGILDEDESKWIYNFNIDTKNVCLHQAKKKLKLIITSNT